MSLWGSSDDVALDARGGYGLPMLRVVGAFLVAPLVGVIGGALSAWMLSWLGDLGGFGYATLLILIGLFYAYAVVLVLGVPLLWLLRHFHVMSLWVFLLAGILFGIVGWLVAASPIPSPEFYFRAFIEGIFGIVSGLVGAAAFWRIGVRENSALTRAGTDGTS